MKMFLTILLGVLIDTALLGQNQFYINSRFKTLEISLNNVTYSLDSNFIKLPTRYPKFDTLQILDGSWRTGTKIICNFKPDSSYSFFMNCCATTDVAATWRFNLLKSKSIETTDSEDNATYELMDRPHITFKIKNGTRKDSIYAWYQDHACFPSFKLIDRSGWEYGAPQKCYYWNNISPLTFFKSKADFNKDTNEFGVVTDVFPEDEGKYEHLGTICVRIFDDRNYVVTYNCKTKKIIMRLKKN